jgi:erythromycin esterase-like protein
VARVDVDRGLRGALAAAAHPVAGAAGDYDALLELVADRRVVLIGEASHGTHDFYAERARLTRRLITERGFDAVAIEGDWPDATRVDRYVTGSPRDAGAEGALEDFARFPAWMWRNRDVVTFVEWLRAENAGRGDPATRVRFVGLDLYSLRSSMEAVVAYLDGVDPQAAQRARERYGCFDHVDPGQSYDRALAHEGTLPCEAQVVEQLVELRRHADSYLSRDGWTARDALFSAEQNAVVVRDAQEYYQQVYRGGESSWNLRDRHMARTLGALLDHLGGLHGRPAKVVVWEHNSHVGDARATTKGWSGQITVGQLARETFGDDAFLIGMTTYDGEVTAAPDWGRPAHRWRVRPALRGSHEELLHDVDLSRYWVSTAEAGVRAALAGPRLERAIGVVYRPIHERQAHYFLSDLSQRFDAVIHLDRTSALEPLDRTSLWDAGEPAQTYPNGF